MMQKMNVPKCFFIYNLYPTKDLSVLFVMQIISFDLTKRFDFQEVNFLNEMADYLIRTILRLFLKLYR